MLASQGLILLFSINNVCQFMHEPSLEHQHDVKRPPLILVSNLLRATCWISQLTLVLIGQDTQMTGNPQVDI